MTNELDSNAQSSNKMINGRLALDAFVFYQIRTFRGQMLDVRGASTSDNADIIEYPANNKDNQRFLVFTLDDGYSIIAAKNSGKLFRMVQSVATNPVLVQDSYRNVDT